MQIIGWFCSSHCSKQASPVINPWVESLVGGGSNVGRLHVECGRVGRRGVAGQARAGHVGRGRGRVGGEAGAFSVDIVGFPLGAAGGEEISQLSFITSVKASDDDLRTK